LANEQEIHEVYGLGDVGLFDEFFCFLREPGIMKILEQLAPRQKSIRIYDNSDAFLSVGEYE
jgi:hypothetical protein